MIPTLSDRIKEQEDDLEYWDLDPHRRYALKKGRREIRNTPTGRSISYHISTYNNRVKRLRMLRAKELRQESRKNPNTWFRYRTSGTNAPAFLRYCRNHKIKVKSVVFAVEDDFVYSFPEGLVQETIWPKEEPINRNN